MPASGTSQPWPPLPYADWEPTKQTLHRYAQIVGKIRMALVPFRNHWWHVTLYVGARGLTTGPMPYRDLDVEIAFDLIDHELRIQVSDGRVEQRDLTQRSACADLYADLFAALDRLGVQVEIDPQPYGLDDSPGLNVDRVHASYDPESVTRYWRVLASTQRSLFTFLGRFSGKASPVQLFWHSLDLAHARYSGQRVSTVRAAPVDAEAYSHEVIAFGFWPGDERSTPFPAFYSYTAPEPEGLTTLELASGAEWQDTGAGTLAVLPYDTVRSAGDPSAALIEFYESAYQAGARAAGWNRESFATREQPQRLA